MYIVGFVIPVPEEKLEAYRDWSKRSVELLTEYGCLEVVESWEDDVPDGTHTDFRRAVGAKPGEKIVFSWQKWPDKSSVDAVEKAMSEDPRFNPQEEIPFDQKRLIVGCFRPIMSTPIETD
ncbi:DUF1428 domain-containing protein [uncultured Ruegeria sp.]|uniref:DUF1428 domain-containing protein n=1 Tax=uncultured Ruegeria sp. TaxID=259304 RepID=UPI0026072301|nr:DUF1428 domain-containing protein [uncultured Ruegeria sp.]